MIALILAGGGGTRLWPVSRQGSPKQLESIIGPLSMLKATYARVRSRFEIEDIYVATAEDQAAVVLSQLPELSPDNIMREPCRRDTAAAIGYALLRLSVSRPDDIFVVINSDAHVRDPDAYHAAIAAAGRTVAADPDRTALIGLRPSYPETGYGYIKLASRLGHDGEGLDIHEVDRFVEKPDRKTAEGYLADGGYLWNPTLIVGRVRSFLELYRLHLPRHAELFARMRASFGSESEAETVADCFRRLPSISIDYGILEKAERLLALPAEFGWMDIGNWRTVREILARDRQENVVRGSHVEIDSVGNLIHCPEGKLVATVGISDMIIVDTGDALLICPQERAHEVKLIVERLKADEKLKSYL
ncbi:mannose-1-phosphate guanyltransferase [Candidatus Uhrbacteria bacterium CG_4_10_14_0_8_um_filter_58_22]|uniref:Mannose-1-phosphate guanyltransferase n=1 Tax=Candidatus Uhrbacteria bacterium CG_4_10_14_0_8_um_filter_58_22 TaxID=1975029 RepID=A0A2M7QB32_9BACT|nr:MAG: mannose-1-phosphate guanyltransferase [Candidatus Uhrbacteria bacterium CG_4_10_14_0_8_um_filter_58_22]